ncbi:hypothetical protein [Streptomyces sp. NPDC090798]|uniref:hypothetical protein n=1 Tax=Streptomyces sp. NPDC090798 TaxID=3365968 RepID=UPI003811567D
MYTWARSLLEGSHQYVRDPQYASDPLRHGSGPLLRQSTRRPGHPLLRRPRRGRYDPSAVGGAAVLVPPSALPTADVNPIGVNIDGPQQIAVIETLLALGLVMGLVTGLVIGIAAFLVSVTDRAVQRRAHITALSLIGARARTLRAVQCAQVVLPLGIGPTLALVAGKLAESSYLVTGGGAVFWDGAGLAPLALAAVGAVAVAALGTLPLIGRRVNPELIRRD